MTKSNIEKLQKLAETLHELQRKKPIQLVQKFQNEYNEEIGSIENDIKLSEEGKRFLRDAFRAEMAETILKQIAAEDDLYAVTYEEMKQLAEQIAIDSAQPPESEYLMKTFENELAALLISSSLAVDASTSIKQIDAFIAKYKDEPYLMGQVFTKMGDLALNVLAIESTPEIRNRLNNTLERVKDLAIMPEQKEAAKLFEGTNPKPNIYGGNQLVRERLMAMMPRETTNYIDDPQAYFEKKAAQDK